jgi:hypothetical protein
MLSERRHRGLVTAGAVAVLAMMQGAVLIQYGRLQSQLPAYLDRSNEVVAGQLGASLTRSGLMAGIGDQIAADAPPGDALWSWQPQFRSDEALGAWTSGRQIQLSAFEPWAVPERPVWNEDPYGNITWRFYYHSLGWLWAPAHGCLQGRQELCRSVTDYVLSWIRANPRDAPASDYSWYDHSVAYRSDAITSLFPEVLAPVLTPAELGEVLGSLETHGQVLDGYVTGGAFRGHNHNLFHAMSLYNLALVFPELKNASTWRADARKRISELLPEMVDVDEGASLEQAAAYHFVALRLFAEADEYLDKHGDGLTDAERRILARMAEFGALLLSPTMQLPAIGDTSFGTSAAFRTLVDVSRAGIGTEVERYILSHGAEGERPADAHFYPDAGYAILRPTFSPASWEDDLQVVITTFARARPHGHDDVMNVIVNADGGPLLVDGGGPYLYGNDARQALVDARAHNSLVEVGSDATRGPVTDLVERDDEHHSVVAGTFDLTDATRIRRFVILLKPALLLVVDQIDARPGTTHEWELLYHLPPASTVVRSGTSGTVSASGAAMGYRVVSSSPAVARVVNGQSDPLLGWVTPDYNAIVPAPVLTFARTGGSGWFVSAFEPALGGSPVAPSVDVSGGSGADMVIRAAGVSGSYSVRITGDEVEIIGR